MFADLQCELLFGKFTQLERISASFAFVVTCIILRLRALAVCFFSLGEFRWSGIFRDSCLSKDVFLVLYHLYLYIYIYMFLKLNHFLNYYIFI